MDQVKILTDEEIRDAILRHSSVFNYSYENYLGESGFVDAGRDIEAAVLSKIRSGLSISAHAIFDTLVDRALSSKDKEER